MPLLQQWAPPALKSPAYLGLTFDVPGLYFIQGTAAFLVVLLLKMTTQLQHELPEAIFIEQTNHCAVCEGVFLTKQTFSHSFQTWSLRETMELASRKCTWEPSFLSAQNCGLSRDAGLIVHYNFLLLQHTTSPPPPPLSKSADCKVIVSPLCLANKCHFFPSLTPSMSFLF